MATRRARRETALTEIRIYFEGHRGLEAGFEQFFVALREAALAARVEFHLIAAKRGPEDYAKALRDHPLSWNILLKDSEEQMPGDPRNLCDKLGISRPQVDNVFWMVELMESWFLADPGALLRYYGQHFSPKAIGQTADVEKLSKTDVIRRLENATRKTTKGAYNKVTHAPMLLQRLDPEKVKSHAPHCRQLFVAISEKLRAVAS